MIHVTQDIEIFSCKHFPMSLTFTERRILFRSVVYAMAQYLRVCEIRRAAKQVSKAIWQKAASPTYHPSRLQTDSCDREPPSNTWFVGSTRVSLFKRHLDPFSRFYTVHQYYQHTDRHTDHATCDICSNRPHVVHCMQAMRPNMWGINFSINEL